MLKAETDPKRRKAMLAGKVEDMLNTVVRQIAFVEFERRVHDERRQGELTPERIGEIWIDVQRESLGPAIGFDDEYRYYWTYIPHFIHTPFYVYAYAFGDCLVNSLYAVYQGAAAGLRREISRHAARRRHASGTRSCWRPSASTPSDPDFWEKGLSVIAGFIDELEADGLSRVARAWRMTTILPGRMRRYARVSTAMGGLAARLAGERYLGLPLDRAAPCRRSQGGAGRHQGAADEGGAASRHHPRRAAARNMRASWRTLQANAPPMGWAFVQPPHGGRARAATGRAKFASFEHEAARAASLGPGPSRASRRTGARSPASCNIPTWPRRSRPI